MSCLLFSQLECVENIRKERRSACMINLLKIDSKRVKRTVQKDFPTRFTGKPRARSCTSKLCVRRFQESSLAPFSKTFNLILLTWTLRETWYRWQDSSSSKIWPLEYSGGRCRRLMNNPKWGACNYLPTICKLRCVQVRCHYTQFTLYS